MTPDMFYIRWAIRKDVRQIMDIERRSFEYAWDEADLNHYLQTRNTICMVITPANDNEIVLGYMVYELKPTSLELLNLAVSPDFRRHGVGAAMVRKLVEKVAYVHGKRKRITVLVRDSNLAAQLLFRSLGFKALAVLRQAYEECDDDGYLMQYVARVPEGVTA
jgi:ribosomal-protein-alanine N-acetyltransferase